MFYLFYLLINLFQPFPLHILAVLPCEIKYRHPQNADRPEMEQWKGGGYKIILENLQTQS